MAALLMPGGLTFRLGKSFDMTNVIDQSGSLQSDIFIFAFAATVLSLANILLGLDSYERKKSDNVYVTDWATYSEVPNDISEYSYKKTMMESKDLSFLETFNKVLNWAKEKTKKRGLIAAFIDLGTEKLQGKRNPADKLVTLINKMWADT